MLLTFVILYWLISIAIGLYAALHVHNTKDYAVASRALPFHIVTATVFATWFGSEVVLVFTIAVTTIAVNSKLSIYGLVENAYKITLVAAIVPLALGVYWKRATTQGAVVSMLLGLMTWIVLEVLAGSAEAPAWTQVWLPHFVGFLVSLGSFVLFSLLPQFSRTPPIPVPGALGHDHHKMVHAAAHTHHANTKP